MKLGILSRIVAQFNAANGKDCIIVRDLYKTVCGADK